jgi:hypothetical protein
MDVEELAHLLEVQDGLISRPQLLEPGAQQHDNDRMLRPRDLTRLHPGVYLNHTGALTWVQRAWAAVLHYWPAALAQQSALPKPAEAAAIHIAVDVRRTVGVTPAVHVHRKAGFHAKVDWLKSPPRIGVEEAALDAASAAADDLAAIHLVADVCQSRVTTPARLRQALSGRRRLPRGVWLRRIIEDLDEGACSVLEHGHLTRVERHHGLPRGDRQVRGSAAGRPAWRDVNYRAYRTIVELDGRPFHDTARLRDKDFDRDLDAAVDDEALTVRLTYGQVFRTGCVTADRIGRLLQRRGWSTEQN